MLEIPEELPVAFEIKEHEALMNVWFSGMIMQKLADKIFYPKLSTAAQFNLLILLRDNEKGLKQKELCEMMLVNKSNITGLIDRLSQHSLVERKMIEGDRRSNAIILTEKGKVLLEEVNETYLKMVKKVMSKFNVKEMELMIKNHKKLRLGMKEVFENISLNI